jgi:two-component system, sensor histidine kinase and response regulator
MRRIIPIASVLVLLSATVLAWWQVDKQSRGHLQSQFESAAAQYALSINDRLVDYEWLLRSSAGLFVASKEVERDGWVKFVGSLGLDRNFPAIRGIGYVRRIERSGGDESNRLPQHEAAYRILLFHPEAGFHGIVGLDAATWPSVRAALEYSVDADMPSVSDRIAIGGGPPVVLLCLPVYSGALQGSFLVEDRRKSVQGWVVALVDINELALDVSSGENELLSLEIFDGSDLTAEHRLGLPADKVAHADTPSMAKLVSMDFAGHTWTLRVQPTAALTAAPGIRTSTVVLLSGLVITVLLSSVLWVLSHTHSRAIALAREMTAAYRKSEEESRKLASIVAQSDVAAMILAVEGRIEWANESFTRLTGHQVEASIGRRPSTFLAAPSAETTVWSRIQKRMTRGESFSEELSIVARDGREVWVAASGQPIKSDDGAVRNYVALASDVTLRRTQERDLRLAKEQAEVANQAKSAFVANMSHEIRTPLNGILGMLHLLTRTQLSANQARYAETARSSAEALLSLLNDILDFSKIEAGKLQLDVSAFDLPECIEAIVETFGPRAAEKNLELVCHALPGVPRFVRADRDRLRQVLLNLVSNALKFTFQGEVVVEVGMAREDLLRVEVRDTGIGVAQEQMHLLFQDFSQGDASTTRKFGGTGLGLAICKRLAELMGGQIGVQSVAGQGSTFWFTIRVETIAAPAQADPSTPPNLEGLRVLAVDDNSTNCEILVEQLSGCGMLVETAPDSAQALRAMSRVTAGDVPFDLLIIDMQMPDMTGLELARILREGAWKQPAILILSSVDLDAEREALHRLDIETVLIKPVGKSRLLDAILALLARARSRSNKRRSSEPPIRDAGESARAHDPTQTPAGRKAQSLLLVEDHEVNQEVARDLLADMGWTCHIVNNGKEALATLEAARFDLVLMDCQMPEMDGYEATRRIREQEGRGRSFCSHGSRLPVIALTANAVKGDRERCLAAGMDDCVTKPIDPEALENAIRKWLESPSAEAGAEGAQAAQPCIDLPAIAPDVAATGAEGAQAAQPCIDLPALLARCRGKSSLALTLLGKLEQRLPMDLAQLRECAAKSDAVSLARLAHGLKSAAAHMCADPSSRLACSVETLGANGDMEGARPVVVQLEREIENLLGEIPSMRAKLQAGNS